MSGNIVWIASYPKSGNTWVRAFIANLLGDGGGPVHINCLPADNANTRLLFDTMTGIDSANLPAEEIDELRPGFYQALAASSEQPRYYKIHDAYRCLPDGSPIFPAAATRRTLYIVRNPLAVAPSFARFLGRDIDSVIAEMNDDGHALNQEDRDITRMLPQLVSSWSGHVRSWLDAAIGMKVHLMRYEDMLREPEHTFAEAARALGFEGSAAEIRRAVEHSSFARLKEMELADGFRERPPLAAAFFREGAANGWRDVLSGAQVAAIVARHGDMMRRLGYLDADGSIAAP